MNRTAHWIDGGGVTKCGTMDESWKGKKVKFRTPGWYGILGAMAAPGMSREIIFLWSGDSETDPDEYDGFDLCRKCKPPEKPIKRPETVKELLEGKHLYEMCTRVLGATSLETVSPGGVRALEAAIRKELLPPPPAPGEWLAKDGDLHRAGRFMARFYLSDWDEPEAEIAESRAQEVERKLNNYELGLERRKNMSQAEPHPVGAWWVEDKQLLRSGVLIATAFQDSSDAPYEVAHERIEDIAAKLNLFELDKVKWQQVANALEAFDAYPEGVPGRATGRQQLMALLRHYRDGRKGGGS